ncbi:MAG: gliding motility protein GldM [Chitinophagales bacterium]|nr:gliding motility protein GldM [Chitinophagales bacterium]
MSIPKEPRQQMINIMYLVLTALLALNVSSEVLNAFKLINDSIAATNTALDGKNSVLLAELNGKMLNDPTRTKPFLDEASKIRQQTTEFEKYVENLKQRIVKESGGMEGTELKHKKDTETATRIMVEAKEGKLLETKIGQLKQQLISLKLLNAEEQQSLAKGITLSTEYDKKQAEKMGKSDWASYHFDRVPVVAAIALLTKIQGDARNAESLALEALNAKVAGETYKFDELKAASVVPYSYVIAGKQQYKANIFVAATSKTQDMEVYMGQFINKSTLIDPQTGQLKSKVAEFPLREGYKKVDVQNGVANFSELPSTQGQVTRQGVIKVKQPKGSGYDYCPFELSYLSAPPSAVISPEKMNVAYIGLQNPIAISVPGVPAEKLMPTVSGPGTLSGSNGKYNLEVTSPGELTVNVSAKFEDGIKPMGSMTFRIKKVPKPEIKLGNLNPGNVKANKIRIEKSLRTFLYDFVYEVKYEVISFKMQFSDKNGALSSSMASNSDRLTPDMLAYIQKAKPGDAVYFDEIQVKTPSGVYKIPNITYKVF